MWQMQPAMCVTWVCHVANAVCDVVTWGGSCGRCSVKWVCVVWQMQPATYVMWVCCVVDAAYNVYHVADATCNVCNMGVSGGRCSLQCV